MIFGKLKLLENFVAVVCLTCVAPVIFIPPVVAIPTIGLPLGNLVVALSADKSIRLAGVFCLVLFLLGFGFVETVDALGVVDALLVCTVIWGRGWSGGRSRASAWALATDVFTARRITIEAAARVSFH